MTDLVVGCPVAHREWIIPYWWNSVSFACQEASLSPEFVFVVPRADEATRDVLKAGRDLLKHPVEVIFTDEPERDDKRAWNSDRYHHMVGLRNQLLHRVRQIAPKYFWSLDSDILPAPNCLVEMLKVIDEYHAVGSCTYMTDRGVDHASKGDIYQGRLTNRRHHHTETETVRVGCIMASKLMTPTAYSVGYAWDNQGEDVGWSKACAEAGLSLGWCAKAKAKHVMSREALLVQDSRVGF